MLIKQVGRTLRNVFETTEFLCTSPKHQYDNIFVSFKMLFSNNKRDFY